MPRPVFTDGRILRTSDFVADQAYHLVAHRQHNTGQHRWGIATGLQIVLRDGDLIVEPGRAVDGFGRDVVLDHAQALDLRRFDTLGTEAVAVWLVYAQQRQPAPDDGVDRISDAATVELDSADDSDPREPPGVPVTDLRFGAQNPPDDPARRWPIYLGRITRDRTDAGRPPVIDLDRRPYVGLIGATVTSPDHGPWLDLGDDEAGAFSVRLPGPDGTSSTPLTVGDDGVQFTGRLDVAGDLVLHGGSLTVAPGAPALEEPAVPNPDWSLSHSDDGVAHELRVTMPTGGAVPSRLTVGSWRDGAFRPSLVVDETGTVVIAGNLVIAGHLQASSVRESELNDEARRYLAGIQTNSLLSLFTSLPPADIP